MYTCSVVVSWSEDGSAVKLFGVSVLLGKDGRDAVVELDSGSLVAVKVLVHVVAAVGLFGETELGPTVKVNDAVCVIGREELRVSANEEIRVVGWDGDVDCVGPSVLEVDATDEGDISVLCPNVVDEFMAAELLGAVTELICQSVVIVVHGASEGSID